MANLIKKAVNRFILDRFKPLSVHAEAIFIDEVWEMVKKKVGEGGVKTWYIMTPINQAYFKAFFNSKLSEKEISTILKERYLWMLKNNQHLEMHIHFSKIMNLTKEEQRAMVSGARAWMIKEIGIKPKELVPGWWAFNKETLEVIEEFGIKMLPRGKYREIHDYNLLKSRPWLSKDYL